MVYRFGTCELDTNRYTLQQGGQTFPLRLKVFRMCLYLLEHRDRVVSREELCAQVWPGQFVSQATLEGVIRLVRQAVGDSGRTQSIIQTLHGHGYRFVAPVEESLLSDTSGVADDVALPRTAEVSALPENAKNLTEDKDEYEPDASGSDGLQEGAWLGSAVTPGASVDNPKLTLCQWCNGPVPVATTGWWRWLRPALGLIAVLILAGWAVSWTVRAHGAGTYDKSRLAVLPFIDLSAEADQSHVADGLTENLIGELARIHGLTVIARTSVIKYKGSLKDVATIGRELRVGTIVEGSIRRIDGQVRINTQLIDVASQGHLWSQEYDLELPEVFGIKSDISNRVAQWLNVQVNVDSINDCLRVQPQSTTLAQKSRGGH